MRNIRKQCFVFLLILKGLSFLTASGDFDNETEAVSIDEPVLFAVYGGAVLIVPAPSGVLVYAAEEEEEPLLYEGTLGADAVLPGGNGEVAVPAGTVAGFHRNGVLRWATAIAGETVFRVAGQSLTVSAEYSIYTPIAFHSSGLLRYAHLAEPHLLNVRGVVRSCSGPVEFDSDGEVLLCVPDAGGDLQIASTVIPLAPGTCLQFHPSGGVMTFSPRESVTLPVFGAEVSIQAESTVTVHANGNIASCIFARRAVLSVQNKPVEWKYGYDTLFHPDGSLMSGHLAADTAFTVGGMSVLFDSDNHHSVTFYPGGVLKYGFTGETTEMEFEGGMITCPAGTFVHFDDTGRLLEYDQY